MALQHPRTPGDISSSQAGLTAPDHQILFVLGQGLDAYVKLNELIVAGLVRKRDKTLRDIQEVEAEGDEPQKSAREVTEEFEMARKPELKNYIKEVARYLNAMEDRIKEATSRGPKPAHGAPIVIPDLSTVEAQYMHQIKRSSRGIQGISATDIESHDAITTMTRISEGLKAVQEIHIKSDHLRSRPADYPKLGPEISIPQIDQSKDLRPQILSYTQQFEKQCDITARNVRAYDAFASEAEREHTNISSGLEDAAIPMRRANVLHALDLTERVYRDMERLTTQTLLRQMRPIRKLLEDGGNGLVPIIPSDSGDLRENLRALSKKELFNDSAADRNRCLGEVRKARRLMQNVATQYCGYMRGRARAETPSLGLSKDMSVPVPDGNLEIGQPPPQAIVAA